MPMHSNTNKIAIVLNVTLNKPGDPTSLIISYAYKALIKDCSAGGWPGGDLCLHSLNPLVTHPYDLDKSALNFRGTRSIFSFFFHFIMKSI